MLKRLLVAVPFAVLATGGVFYEISALIGDPPDPYPYTQAPEIDFGRKAEESDARPERLSYEPPPLTVYDPIDSGTIPISLPAPLYPACGKGDGEVLLEFTVKANGSVRDVTVIMATSPCFAKAAVRACKRWHYRPQTVDFQAVPSERIRVVIRFIKGNTLALLES